MGNYKATIIILNWQGLNLLKRCVPSVIQAAVADGGGHEILVVDNGSTDGSVQYVLDHFPGVAVLPLPENVGFVQGYNEGLARARQNLVVLLNNSTWVRADFLSNLLVHFKNPEVFAVAPKILYPNGRIEVENLLATWDARGIIGQRQTGLNEPDTNRVAGPCYTFYAPGGCAAFSREKFAALHGFHPLFAPFHWEEVDVSYRAWKRGWKVLYEPRAVAWHDSGVTFRKYVPADQNRLIWLRNRLLFTWSDINDPSMVGQHHGHLQRWLSENPVHREAYARALPLMPLAEQKRYQEQDYWVRSDLDVFGLVGSCCTGFRPNGTLLKGTNGAVYILENGHKRPIRSPGALESISDWPHIVQVPDAELGAYPPGPDVGFREGCLILGPNQAVYRVERGRKRVVISLERLSQLGLRLQDAQPVQWIDLLTLPDGPPA